MPSLRARCCPLTEVTSRAPRLLGRPRQLRPASPSSGRSALRDCRHDEDLNTVFRRRETRLDGGALARLWPELLDRPRVVVGSRADLAAPDVEIGGRNVTFPARQYSVNGERRSFALLRPSNGEASTQEAIRDLILEAYSAAEVQAQPRREMQQEALQELADSIKAQGMMQPIVVRPLGEGRYEIEVIDLMKQPHLAKADQILAG